MTVVALMVDHSDVSNHAVEYALEHHINPGDKIFLVTVAVPDTQVLQADLEDTVYGKIAEEEDGLATMDTVAQESNALAHAKQQGVADMNADLRRYRETIQASSDAHEVHTYVLQDAGDDVGAALVQFLAYHNVDVGIMGRHHQTQEETGVLTAIKKSIKAFIGLGSVSDFVASNSPCPVHVVGQDQH